MRINSFIASIFLMLCNSSAWSQSPDLTFNTVSGTTNADGSELITTVLYEYSDGTSFVVDYHITPSGVSTPGGGFVAPVINFPVSANLPQGGSWGPGPYPGSGGGGPGQQIQGSSSLLDSTQLGLGSSVIGDENDYQINWIPFAIGGAACVINHIVSTRTLAKACEEDGVDDMITGYCGFFGSVRCNEPPPPPPPPPLPDPSAFWGGSMYLWWSPPFDWDWTDEGPFIVSDGF